MTLPVKSPLSPQLVMRLQKTSGNRTVQRLLARHAMLRAADEAAASAERESARSRWWLPKLFRGGRKRDEGT